MTINKQALRQLAVDAKELAIIKRYTKGIEEQKKFIAEMTPATVLALLDELEAEQRICSTWRKTAESNSEKLEAAEKRMAELEARTITVKQFDDFQIVNYGGSEDYAKGYIDCQNNYNKALTAAGIGVKGE